jgi:hypothetical protein
MNSELGRLVEVYRNHGPLEAARRGGRHVGRRLVQVPVGVGRRVVRPLYQPPSLFYHSRYARTHNVFTEEWDLLVVLDTCRPDALRAVAEEYEFVGDVESRWSVGANSSEWILNTFSRQFAAEIAETAYVTSNPHSETVIENQLDRHYDGELRPVDRRTRRYTTSEPVGPADFERYVPLYDRSVDHDDLTYPDPRAVTDHAITIDRSVDPRRMVLHYMPPHLPYVARRDGDDVEIGPPRDWASREAYLDNLRWGLSEVALLLRNVDRDRVVVTADHGENFTLRSVLPEHKPGMVSPAVRRVPWAVTTATDTGEHDPDLEDTQRAERAEMLGALGYR